MRKNRLVLFLGLLCLSLTACGGKKSSESTEETSLKENTAEASTDISEDESGEAVSSPEKKAFTKYINDVLIPKFGIYVDTTSSTVLRDSATNTLDYSDWLPSKGLMAAKIHDFDGDEQEEMLLVLMKENNNKTSSINANMYECENGKVTLADKMVCLPYSDGCSGDLDPYSDLANVFQKSHLYNSSFGLSMAEEDGHTYLFHRLGESGVFSDGIYNSYWLMEYNGEKFEHVRSFTQTAGGSAYFEYTGYIFEDGELQEVQDLYHEDDENSLYATFETAFSSFFGELVPVSRGVYEYDYTGNDVDFYDSSVENILMFDIESENYEEYTKYIFYEELKDNTNLHADYKAGALDVNDGQEVTTTEAESTEIATTEVATTEAATTEIVTTEAKKATTAAKKKPTTETKKDTATTEEKKEDSKSTICSFSSERLLTDEEIQSIKKKDFSSYHFPEGRGVVQMMINEIFARQGYVFKDADLNDYFGQFDWYKDLPKNNNSAGSVEGQMTRTEQKNITKLLSNE